MLGASCQLTCQAAGQLCMAVPHALQLRLHSLRGKDRPYNCRHVHLRCVKALHKLAFWQRCAAQQVADGAHPPEDALLWHSCALIRLQNVARF